MSAVGACASADRVQLRNFLRARCEENGRSRDCRITNLSTQRAVIESFVPPVTGSKVNLQFRLPNGHQICAAGLVTNHQFREGFSVDFIDLASSDRDQINSLRYGA
jgi:hypothetical protein